MKVPFTVGSWSVRYNSGMAQPDQIAHAFRRTGFRIPDRAFSRHASTDIHDLIDERLNARVSVMSEEDANARNLDDVDWYSLPAEFLEQMMAADAGLHERMVWFWHGHFTTERGETNHREMWRQHQLIRRHALGNVRELTRAIITDGAMLHYLDGSSSRGAAPNENFSREFLELFMLGRNQGYTEDDIRAGARILAGWNVDYQTGDITFDEEFAYDRPVTFLGRRARWDLDGYVEAVLDQPGCADHIAAAIHSHLVSTPLEDDRRNQLGQVLRGNDWEVLPLLEEMLHGDDFVEARGRRTRQPVEWFTAATAAFGIDRFEELGVEYWHIQQMGQVPFEPPNAAGWPDDDRWSSASQVIARGHAIMDWEVADRVINSVEPTASAVLAHCGIAEPSPQTIAALEHAIEAQTEFDYGLELLLSLALLSPEFSVV